MESRKKATALKYKTGEDAAPKVIAKGMGLVAENIINIAENQNIPVYQDEVLSNQLYHLQIGEEIPEDMYEVVAEVLLFIASLDH